MSRKQSTGAIRLRWRLDIFLWCSLSKVFVLLLLLSPVLGDYAGFYLVE